MNDEDWQVFEWKRDYLMSLGYSESKASYLAAQGADPHEYEALLEMGCDMDRAVEILT